MRLAIIILALVVALAGCTTAERDFALGAAAGGVVGGVAAGTTSGLLAGAAIGGVAAYVIGRAVRKGYCIYRDPRTYRRYTDVCPAGYR